MTRASAHRFDRDSLGLLAELGRVLVVLAAGAALWCALVWPHPIWTLLVVLTILAAVTAAYEPSPGADRGMSSPGA
ncbi:hypothetical protein, partial [Nocardia otitidiscaviarum]|uniref:hypothetical protein n=1 Tax=Nocardia otitidiscaviarum TaxID=1823 RepID=UPI0005850D45